nr:hypothetical protein CFP56_07286 [Quercus suber]
MQGGDASLGKVQAWGVRGWRLVAIGSTGMAPKGERVGSFEVEVPRESCQSQDLKGCQGDGWGRMGRCWYNLWLDNRWARGCFMAYTPTLKTDGSNPFILDLLETGAYPNLGCERGVQINLDAEPRKSSSDIINGVRIDFEEVSQLVTDPLENASVIEFNGELR